MIAMNELGEVLHMAKSGRLIVKISAATGEKKVMGTPVIDLTGKQIGKIQEIFGPVVSPYASVQPSREKLTSIIGTKVFITDEASFRKMRFKRHLGRKTSGKNAGQACRRVGSKFSK
jgi:RNA-binding protein